VPWKYGVEVCVDGYDGKETPNVTNIAGVGSMT